MNEELAEIGKQVEEEQARIDAAREAARLERVAAAQAERLERAQTQLAQVKAQSQGTPGVRSRKTFPPPPIQNPEPGNVDSDDADES